MQRLSDAPKPRPVTPRRVGVLLSVRSMVLTTLMERPLLLLCIGIGARVY
jgi:hypothetical protein